MSFESELKSHLSHSTISALVDDRIYPVIRPQGADVPALTYLVVSLDQVNSLSGRADTLRNFRVQIDCWAKKHSDMLYLESAVRTRMDTAATAFRAVMMPGAPDEYEPETKLYRRMLEFSCWFNES